MHHQVFAQLPANPMGVDDAIGAFDDITPIQPLIAYKRPLLQLLILQVRLAAGFNCPDLQNAVELVDSQAEGLLFATSSHDKLESEVVEHRGSHCSCHSGNAMTTS